VRQAEPPAPDLLGLVREGILLRRSWDRIDRDAAGRRELLRLLPAVQTLCQEQLAAQAADAAASPALLERVLRQLAEDEQSLAELVADAARSPDQAAFAVECFRDDLYWLGTLVAVADGRPGTDVLGRILLEQEVLERQMDGWHDPASLAGGPSSQTPSGIFPNELLRLAARRLRTAALVRQVEALLAQPRPEDWRGWFEAWQAASRLAGRVGAEAPLGGATADSHAAVAPVPQETREAIERLREQAAEGWEQAIASLPGNDVVGALRESADELVDTAAEALTFLEDLSLPAGVRTLEILDADSHACLQTVREHPADELRGSKRALRRQRRRVRGELQDRRLTLRMETLLGHRAVAALERFVFGLLLLFIVVLVAEPPLIAYEQRHWLGGNVHAPSVVEAVFAWVDLAICLVFLGEFSLKISLAEGKWLYFRRNWLTGLLPAIPFGFLAFATHQVALLVEEAELFVLLRALRYLRLPQVARWLRIARPVLRAVRLVGFVIWASDRLVKQLSPMLNRNVVLFERGAMEELQTRHHAALVALRERFAHRAAEMFAGLTGRARVEIIRARIDDLTAMLAAPTMPRRAGWVALEDHPAREFPLEVVIARLQSATPAGVSESVSRSLAQSLARWCRAFDLFAIRRLPLVRELVAAGRLPSPYETVAQLANRAGQMLQGFLDRVYWFADLHGTVTAPQLVDSIGDWMVKGTARPARRFLLFGGLFVILSYLASLLPSSTLNALTGFIGRMVGAPLIVLGTLCLVPLLIGIWFRQIAGEATDFYTRVAEAQFIAATKDLKRRLAARHRAFLHQRVIAPEMETAARDETGAWPAAAERGPDGSRSDAPGEAGKFAAGRAGKTVELLWQDYLEGAPFHRGDTHTTTQLLGNLTLLSLRQSRLCYGRGRRKQLRRLDLAHTRGSIRGPYLWFHCISRSLAQQTARLLVDYDAFAIPLARAATADDEEVRRYLGWLRRRLRRRLEPAELPAGFRQRAARLAPPPDRAEEKPGKPPEAFEAADFTAIHFLSDDPELEADIRRRYGDLVGDLLRRDRRDNIRRVFRTYPFHRWPREQRSFNPLAFYQRHLAGGWALVFPFKVAWWMARLAGRGLRGLAAGVRDVLRHRVAEIAALDEPDPLAVAVRKIHRMRKPVFMECLRMRAEFDPEYLGATLTGLAAGDGGDGRPPAADAPGIEEDLAAVNAPPSVRRQFGRMAAERRRQIGECRHWIEQLGIHAVPAESLRAMAVAYAIDYRGIRRWLEATRLLRQAFDEAASAGPSAERAKPPYGWPGCNVWKKIRLDRSLQRLFDQPAFRGLDERRRAISREWVLQRPRLQRLLQQLTARHAPADPVEHARQVLASVARDPTTWSQQLVVLRTVQTLSVLDLKTYCDLVAELGEYGPCASGGP